MSMPNLDAVEHQWVAAVAGYNFEIGYMPGADNKVMDALSPVSGHLDKDTIKELLSHATHYGVPWAKADDP